MKNKSVIEKLSEFRKKETEDWRHKISEEEKTSIQKGIKQANNKELEPHSSARKHYEKWL